MKKLFCYAEKYIAKSDWKDFAMLKFCLFSMGILAGMQIPKRNRKQAGWIAAVVFTGTNFLLSLWSGRSNLTHRQRITLTYARESLSQ